jgi:hypothetical protein
MKCKAVTCSFLVPLMLLVVAGTAIGAAATAPKPLTNDDIVTMVQAGLPQDVVIEKIKTSKTAFDTSTDADASLRYEAVFARLQAPLALRNAKSLFVPHLRGRAVCA